MCERHLEDIIAEYPHEFFPGYELHLLGRQRRLSSGGILDLLFLVDRKSDHTKSFLLIELKSRTLKSDDIMQIKRYREDIIEEYEYTSLGIASRLIAPSIPQQVRKLIDDLKPDLDIGYQEIPIHEFQRVAQYYGVASGCPVLFASTHPRRQTVVAMDELRRPIRRSKVRLMREFRDFSNPLGSIGYADSLGGRLRASLSNSLVAIGQLTLVLSLSIGLAVVLSWAYARSFGYLGISGLVLVPLAIIWLMLQALFVIVKAIFSLVVWLLTG